MPLLINYAFITLYYYCTVFYVKVFYLFWIADYWLLWCQELKAIVNHDKYVAYTVFSIDLYYYIYFLPYYFLKLPYVTIDQIPTAIISV